MLDYGEGAVVIPCFSRTVLKGNGSSQEINFVWGEGGHLLSWLTSLERTMGVIVTSHSAALLGPALCQQPAEQGELPKGTCQLQIITCSQNKPFQCDVTAWLQNALVAVLGSPAGLCSSWHSRDQPGAPGSEIRVQWHPLELTVTS